LAVLSFTSFRHGGFTEGGDAELTDRELLAQGANESRLSVRMSGSRLVRMEN
jgi:hypothetical protein